MPVYSLPSWIQIILSHLDPSNPVLVVQAPHCILWKVSRKDRPPLQDNLTHSGHEVNLRDTSSSSSWFEVDYWAPTFRNLLLLLRAWRILWHYFIFLLLASEIQMAESSQILRTKSRNETKKESPAFSYERWFTQMCDVSWSRQDRSGITAVTETPALIPGCVWNTPRLTHL